MTRTKVIFGAASLLSLVAFTTIALTQETQNKQSPRFAPPEVTGSFNPNDFAPRQDGPVKSTYDSQDEFVPNESVQRPSPQAYESVPHYGAPSMGTPIPTGVPVRTRTIMQQIRTQIAVPMTPDEVKQSEEFQKARQKLKVARDEDARKAAIDVIQKHLVRSFEQDLKQREKDLAAVEERVKLLRQQLEKRKTVKDDIISLRLKTIVNNADGLGFPGDEDTSEYSNPSTFGPGSFPGAENGLPPSNNVAPGGYYPPGSGSVPLPNDPNENEFVPRKE